MRLVRIVSSRVVVVALTACQKMLSDDPLNSNYVMDRASGLPPRLHPFKAASDCWRQSRLMTAI